MPAHDKHEINSVFDVAIIGGGIIGACALRDSVMRGFRTILIEAQDFSFGTSSRSSKLLHGGLRYLEQGDFALVFEALRERARLRFLAPHLSRETEFLVPVIPRLTRPGWQLRSGLLLYDVLARLGHPRSLKEYRFSQHRRLSLESEQAQYLRDMGVCSSDLYAYADGQMDDARLTIETILDAVRRGAVALNHTPVQSLEHTTPWTIRCDSVENPIRAKVVINAAGPWMPELHTNTFGWGTSAPTPQYSRGTHLLFNVPWDTSAVLLPTGVPGRIYWILPYFCSSGKTTLVGTTDLASETNVEDPQPTPQEVEELLGFLARDVPDSQLNQSSLHAAFSGMRILAAQKTTQKTSRLSRREVVIEESNYLGILGGKYTTGRHIAETVVNRAARLLGAENSGAAARETPLSVAIGDREREELEARVSEKLLGSKRARDLARDVVRRYGRAAESIIARDDFLPLGEEELLTSAEIVYSVQNELVYSSEDLYRRMGLDKLPLSPLTHEAVRQLAETALREK